MEDEAAKRHAFDVIVEHVLPGRSTVARPTNDAELRKTLVLDLEITEGSAKVRTGGPIDDEEDMDLPVWAGVVPLRLVPGAPDPGPRPDHHGPPRARRAGERPHRLTVGGLRSGFF